MDYLIYFFSIKLKTLLYALEQHFIIRSNPKHIHEYEWHNCGELNHYFYIIDSKLNNPGSIVRWYSQRGYVYNILREVFGSKLPLPDFSISYSDYGIPKCLNLLYYNNGTNYFSFDAEPDEDLMGNSTVVWAAHINGKFSSGIYDLNKSLPLRLKLMILMATDNYKG